MRMRLIGVGPIIRINPEELHIHDPDYFDEVYPSSKPSNKPVSVTALFGKYVGTHFFYLPLTFAVAPYPFLARRLTVTIDSADRY